MHATLEFNLPEDNAEFKITTQAMDWALAMFELDDFLRSKLNYTYCEEFDKIREKLFEILEDHNLTFNDIE